MKNIKLHKRSQTGAWGLASNWDGINFHSRFSCVAGIIHDETAGVMDFGL